MASRTKSQRTALATVSRQQNGETISTAEVIAEVLDRDPSASAMNSQIERLKHASVDAIVGSRFLSAELSPDADVETLPADRVRLLAKTPQGDMPLGIRDGAHQQFAEKLQIPRTYYDRMLQQAPELLVQNMNHWLHVGSDKRLLRMLNPLDDRDEQRSVHTGARLSVRAVLSDSYRPLDHGSLLNVVLPVMAQARAEVVEWNLNDERFSLRAAMNPIDVRDILRTLDGGRWADVSEEKIRAGVSIRNSETGHSSLSVEDYIRILICSNGATASARMRIAHLGRKQEQADDFVMSNDTKRLDDAAIFLRVRDRVAQSLSDASQEKIAVMIGTAAGAKIELPSEVPMMTFIENVGRRFELNDEEVGVLQDEVVHEMTSRSRPLTSFAVSQGFTALARRKGDDGSFERKVDLEEIGWRVMEDGLESLLKAGRAEGKPTKARRN